MNLAAYQTCFQDYRLACAFGALANRPCNRDKGRICGNALPWPDNPIYSVKLNGLPTKGPRNNRSLLVAIFPTYRIGELTAANL